MLSVQNGFSISATGSTASNRSLQPLLAFSTNYCSLCEKRLGGESRGNWGNWYSCLHHLKKYENREDITFAEITSEWVQGFKDYLDNDAVAWTHDYRKRIKDHPLARNSKMSYFNKLRACLNQAYEERIIAVNPLRGIDGFKAEEETRMYLTIDEVKKLAQTECEYPQIKAAFLFSCLTGLQRSDVLRLRWGDVYQQGDFTRIIFKQKKTAGQEYLDITTETVELMGERGNLDDYVFTDIHSPSCTNNTIKLWVAKAGINKDITFHLARHREFYKYQIINRLIYLSMKVGHDKETSKLLYSTLFCHFKEPLFSFAKILFSKQKDKYFSVFLLVIYERYLSLEAFLF